MKSIKSDNHKRQFCSTRIKYLLIFSLVFGMLAGCGGSRFKKSWIRIAAPAVFEARFETTEGSFLIEAHREWSPKGVDRLYQLIRHGYYTDVPIYRVVPGFVAQFGHLDSTKEALWDRYPLTDEPVLTKNDSATIAFARSGKNTRDTQLYINLAKNSKLDTSGQTRGIPGFPVIARVISGMEVVQQFHAYQDTPRRQLPNRMAALPYFMEHFPKMAVIKKAVVVKKR
jgi:cyclophilin family peptidyl-prolyl cis-trans isomerase